MKTKLNFTAPTASKPPKKAGRGSPLPRLVRILRFFLPRPKCEHVFDPQDMRNHRALDGTIKWECWKCGEVFAADCGISILVKGRCVKRPGRTGSLWGSDPNAEVRHGAKDAELD